MTYSRRILDAIALAYDLHKDQIRKCGEAPYMTHLLTVASLVGEYGGKEEQFIAAMLHDAVEDQGGKVVLEQIRDAFGDTVAELVWACTDAWGEPKPPWRERKEAHIARIETAPMDARLIIAADKLHNLQSVLRTYDPQHDGAYWQNFRGGREGTLWYYHAMGEALQVDWQHPILVELEEAREALFFRVAEAPTVVDSP